MRGQLHTVRFRGLSLALACIALCVALLACTSPSPRRAATPRPKAQPAGFLGDYAGFRRLSSGALAYRRRDADLSQYQTVLLEPLVFWESSAQPIRAISETTFARHSARQCGIATP